MKNVNLWTRRLHRYGAVVFAAPLLLVIATGLLLQLKKQLPWVQPPNQHSQNPNLVIDWDEILTIAKTDPDAKIAGWNDVDRLDVRPNRGIIKVRSESDWELQLDAGTGKILSSKNRRSDWIESLHDGSFFSDDAKLYLFFPNGLALLGLWLSGMYLWWLPVNAKRKKRTAKRTAKRIVKQT